MAAAGGLDAGQYHTCALLDAGSVRCWGFNADGQLGYANTRSIGDDETPGSVGPVDLGAGTVAAISAGDFHTCALLDGGSVRCWGLGADGRLGYGNQNSIGDNEAPGSVGPVDVGGPAKAISAGGGHTCAILTNGSVRCWGYGYSGQLGSGNTFSIGDNETPGSLPPVDLGGLTAKAISAGGAHTCAILDDATVRCWGNGSNGRLGYADTKNVQTPTSVGPVDLGGPAKAVSAGDTHTCAILVSGSVRCWGFGFSGQLGYGNQDSIGDNETPGSVAPVDLGGRGAVAVSAGGAHTCAILDDGSVRCWGYGADGRLGYANTANIGDHQTPGSVGPVDLGPGRSAVAISAGVRHTCARLDDGSVRCWGYGGDGRLGYCDQLNIGDDETPGSAGPVDLVPGGAGCARPPSGGSPGMTAATAPGSRAVPSTTAKLPVASDAPRARGLHSCLATAAAHALRERTLAGRGSSRQRAKARRHANLHARDNRRRCLRLYARTPGRVTGLRALTRGKTQIELGFNAAGSDGTHPPAARSYAIKQSLRPLRSARDFARAQTLCKGACRFTVSQVGGKISLTVTDLRPHTTYYYTVAARDNVSSRRGARSPTVKAKTR